MIYVRRKNNRRWHGKNYRHYAGIGSNLPISNVHLGRMQTIGVSADTPLKEGASIGVTMETLPTANEPLNIIDTYSIIIKISTSY